MTQCGFRATVGRWDSRLNARLFLALAQPDTVRDPLHAPLLRCNWGDGAVLFTLQPG